jgi:hypothetical protein
MKIGRNEEHNLNRWRCPNCGGKDYWPKYTVACHDNYCSNCGIKLEWEEETYKENFHNEHSERHRATERW